VGTRIKFAAPETLRQAQRWQAIKDRYVIEGLCGRCAAQAAWAHQNRGDTWPSIHPPCAACQPVVTGFAAPTPSLQWRRIPQPESPVSATAPITMAESEIGIRASGDAGIDLLATAGVN
jgi:hypothetical protein